MTGAAFRKLALSFPGTEERPHFTRTAFRTTRKTFATLAADGSDANVVLEPDAQESVCEAHPEAVHPVPGGWGRMGWTTIVLAKANAALVKKILIDAHALALPKPPKPRKQALRKK